MKKEISISSNVKKVAHGISAQWQSCKGILNLFKSDLQQRFIILNKSSKK